MNALILNYGDLDVRSVGSNFTSCQGQRSAERHWFTWSKPVQGQFVYAVPRRCLDQVFYIRRICLLFWKQHWLSLSSWSYNSYFQSSNLFGRKVFRECCNMIQQHWDASLFVSHLSVFKAFQVRVVVFFFFFFFKHLAFSLTPQSLRVGFLSPAGSGKWKTWQWSGTRLIIKSFLLT